MAPALHPKLERANLRAAWWALRSLLHVRRELRRGRVGEVAVQAPPPLPAAAVRGVNAVLRRRRHTCLERALLLQRWFAAQGQERDVVVGVVGPAATFRAHAWLDGEDDADEFVELTRYASDGGRHR